MSRLDDVISNEWYIYQCLLTYRLILESGSCNDCSQFNNQCRYAPKIGQLVRYNCPFYSKEEEGGK